VYSFQNHMVTEVLCWLLQWSLIVETL